MSMLDKLATALNRRDEEPNIAVAKEIVSKNNKAGVKELVENLSNKSKDIQHDCIKALYEVGVLQPSMIAGYLDNFIALLSSKNNRLQWGAMTAISAMAGEFPKEVYAVLTKIVKAADDGSVITRDHCVEILISLCSKKQYADDSFALLLEQIRKSPPNQLPMYAEKSLPVITVKNKTAFIKSLQTRLEDMESETKRKRVEKVIGRLSAKG
jgi:hypothetical protein